MMNRGIFPTPNTRVDRSIFTDATGIPEESVSRTKRAVEAEPVTRVVDKRKPKPVQAMPEFDGEPLPPLPTPTEPPPMSQKEMPFAMAKAFVDKMLAKADTEKLASIREEHKHVEEGLEVVRAQKDTPPPPNAIANELPAFESRPLPVYEFAKDVDVLNMTPFTFAICSVQTNAKGEMSFRLWTLCRNEDNDIKEAIERVRQQNPYACFMNIFKLAIGGGFGGAPIPPPMDQIVDREYQEKHMQNLWDDYMKKQKAAANEHERRRQTERTDVNKEIQKKRAVAKQAVKKQKRAVKSGKPAAEAMFVPRRNADGSITMVKKEIADMQSKMPAKITRNVTEDQVNRHKESLMRSEAAGV